jgi:hypothetical protein
MNSGDWIEDPENAHDFGRGDAALQYVAANQLTNVEIVHAFSDPQYDFSMGPIDFPGRNEPD